METYRRGRNETHSKCVCREIGTWVRIPPSPPNDKKLHNFRCGLKACTAFCKLRLLEPTPRGLNPSARKHSRVVGCLPESKLSASLKRIPPSPPNDKKLHHFRCDLKACTAFCKLRLLEPTPRGLKPSARKHSHKYPI